MDIVKRIEELDVHLTVMKLYANSYYDVLSPLIPTYIGIDGEQINDLRVIIDERLRYKKEKKTRKKYRNSRKTIRRNVYTIKRTKKT